MMRRVHVLCELLAIGDDEGHSNQYSARTSAPFHILSRGVIEALRRIAHRGDLTG